MNIKNLFKKRGRQQWLAVRAAGGVTPTLPMQLSAVYACVEVLAKSLAMLPLEPYRRDECGHHSVAADHRLHPVLGLTPNPVMTRYTLVELLVRSMLLQGNGYAFIERDAQLRPVALHYLPAGDVTVNAGAYINEPPTYTVAGLALPVPAEDMIHIVNYSDDGVTGVSTLRHAIKSTELASYAQGTALRFYESGGAVSGLLSTENPLTEKQQQEIREAWRAQYGNGNGSGIAVLTRGMKYQAISVPPQDAQLLESRKYSTEEICRFFQVAPQKIFDYTHSSYSTVEATESAFLNDTLLPLIVRFEQEMSRKLFTPAELAAGYCVKFNTSGLMRADKAGQASYYSTMFNIGALSVNDIRRDIDLPHVEGGDRHFVQVNLMELQHAGQGEGKNTAAPAADSSGAPNQ